MLSNIAKHVGARSSKLSLPFQLDFPALQLPKFVHVVSCTRTI